MASESQNPVEPMIEINIKEDVTYFVKGPIKFRVTTTEINSSKDKS